jgi:hypothetical protein
VNYHHWSLFEWFRLVKHYFLLFAIVLPINEWGSSSTNRTKTFVNNYNEFSYKEMTRSSKLVGEVVDDLLGFTQVGALNGELSSI